MRNAILATLLLGLSMTAIAPASVGQDTTTVHLLVHTDVGDENGVDPEAHAALPGTASCDVTVPAGSNGQDVLLQATLDGCILGWTESPTFPGFVETIDGLHAPLATWFVMSQGAWWQFHVNGEPSSVGILDYTTADGDVVEFLYESGEL